MFMRGDIHAPRGSVGWTKECKCWFNVCMCVCESVFAINLPLVFTSVSVHVLRDCVLCALDVVCCVCVCVCKVKQSVLCVLGSMSVFLCVVCIRCRVLCVCVCCLM